MADAPRESTDRVLSTLNRDGSRRWLTPRLSKGRYLTRRRFVAYALIVVYNVLPWIPINGKPAIHLDLPGREFTFFGMTFLPTDTLLLMLFLAAVFVAIFLMTALFGCVWCGWACPQTVYMEFVYRPIERLFLGATPTARNKHQKSMPLRRILMYAAFFLVSLHLAHTFLAYFVGPEELFRWTQQSPFEHPRAFLTVAAITGLMMFDFAFFREQTCIVACPYGRFQSVMLDRHSLIISYDEDRGEPRGKLRKPSRKSSGDVELPKLGDCIDCHMCVTTCPTGIDIRDGLQMECIGCAQCIDACDSVMDKIGRPRGLIRYSSEAAMESGRRRLLRPRVVIYPTVLAAILVLFGAVLATKGSADVTILRGSGRPYVTLPTGEISNEATFKIVNRADVPHTFRFDVAGLEGARIVVNEAPVTIEPGGTATIASSIIVPPDRFHLGRAEITIRVSDEADFSERLTYRLQGPWSAGANSRQRTQDVDR